MLSRFALAAVIFSAPVMAAADIYADCQSAIAAGDMETAGTLGATLLRVRNVTNPDSQLSGARCLTAVTGVPHVYSLTLAKFLPVAEEEIAAQMAADEAKVALERSQAAAAEREAKEKFAADLQAEAAAALAEKERKVWQKVQEACTEIYDDDPNAAVTNAVCLNYFLTAGLPD